MFLNQCFYSCAGLECWLGLLTVHSEFRFSRCDATVIFRCTAVDTHVSRQHGGNDKLVAALLVFVDHVMVILLQQLAIFIPANCWRGLADHNAVKADRITIGDVLTLQLCQEDWSSYITRANDTLNTFVNLNGTTDICGKKINCFWFIQPCAPASTAGGRLSSVGVSVPSWE